MSKSTCSRCYGRGWILISAPDEWGNPTGDDQATECWLCGGTGSTDEGTQD